MNAMKVEVEALTSMASNMQDAITKIDKSYKNIKSIVEKSPRYWQGDASTKHVEMLEKVNTAYSALYTDLSKAPNDMNKAAGNYEAVESTIAEELFTLPSNVMN